MAYSGFISDPDYVRRSQDETIEGKWIFENEINFKKVIRGTAIATYYGDLAEYYEYSQDEVIPTGSLVKFGGNKQITKTNPRDNNFFGIISSKPGVVLNNKPEEQNFLPVALCGKVPCRVIGQVKKFDKLTPSSYKGVAKKKTILDTLLGKPTIGRALENKNSKSENLIEIFVYAHI